MNSAARTFTPSVIPFAQKPDELEGVDYDYMLAEPEPLDWAVHNLFLTETVGLISGNGGAGKCLGAGTPVLMLDGSVLPVEEIAEGDLLIGPDSRPRRVRGVTTGVGPLFRVTPVKGAPYVVNGNHVLSLKYTPRAPQWQRPTHAINISVMEFLALPTQERRHLMGWRAGIDWPEQEVEIPPYLLGLWLGDGHTGMPRITTADADVVVAEMEAFGADRGLAVRRVAGTSTGKASTYSLGSGAARKGRSRAWVNPFVAALVDYGVYQAKEIPQQYLINSADVRLELLAGLIDTDGHLSKGYYEITQKSTRLAEQITFLARSLGFAAYMKITMKRSQQSELRPYTRVSISGDISRIPVRIKHKKAGLRKQKKRVTVTSIEVEPIGEGRYYGFEVDGDHLFLLGDFTVTHNSTLMMQLATCATLGLPWLGIAVKPVKALMLACEDDRRIVRLRQRWINRALDRDMADVLDAGLDIIPRSGRDNTLMALDRASWSMKRTPLFEQLVLRCRRTGIQLVIVDTVSKTFGGRDMEARLVTQYIDEMQRLAELIHGIVLLTQHPSMYGRKSGTGESGSVQWENAVRSRIYVHKHQALGLVIEGMKSNYSEKAAPLKIEWAKGVFRPVEPPPARDYSEPQGYGA